MKQTRRKRMRLSCLCFLGAVMLFGLIGCNKAAEDENIPAATNTPTMAPLATNTPVPEAATSTDAFEYEENAYGGITIKKLKDTSLREVVIPATIDGKTVTEVAGSAFSSCSNLVNVEIPATVTRIGSGAFSGCTKLKSITLPFVGEEADGSGNELLGYIFGGSGNTYHYGWVPDSLSKVTITGGSEIGDYAFYKCSDIKELTLPESIVSIGENAFAYCSGLETIYFAGTLEQWKELCTEAKLSGCEVHGSDGETEYE